MDVLVDIVDLKIWVEIYYDVFDCGVEGFCFVLLVIVVWDNGLGVVLELCVLFFIFFVISKFVGEGFGFFFCVCIV